jgi:hypothetical protein
MSVQLMFDLPRGWDAFDLLDGEALWPRVCPGPCRAVPAGERPGLVELAS